MVWVGWRGLDGCVMGISECVKSENGGKEEAKNYIEHFRVTSFLHAGGQKQQIFSPGK